MNLRRYLFVALSAGLMLAVLPSGAGSQETSEDEAGTVDADATSPTTATAQIVGPDGASLGTVTLTEGPNGVLVHADVTGLSPGGHGFHIHEVGACEPDFSAAGGHFAPTGQGHGFMTAGGHHAGDLPNIYAAADGSARADTFTDAVTLESGPVHSLFDADGSAIIIHALPDSYGDSPGAGDRIGCGVIVADSGEAADGTADDDDDMATEEGPPEEMPAG